MHFFVVLIQSLQLEPGRGFSPVSATNKTDYHDITEIFLKVALNTIILTQYHLK